MDGLQTQTLKIGQRFALKNQAFEVTFVDSTSVRYASLQGGRTYSMTAQTFWELVDVAKVGFLSLAEISNKDMADDFSLTNLTESERHEMYRRFKYVKKVLTEPSNFLSKKNRLAAIKQISEELADEQLPSISTIARWVKIYINSGMNVFSLVPQHRQKGDDRKKFPLEIENLIARKIRDDYMTLERPKVEQLYCNIIGSALEELSTESTKNLPSVRTIHRRVKELDPYILDLKRHGPRYADARHRSAGTALETSRLMQIVMIDGHKMDVLVIDPETGEVLGRPCLVCLFDVQTRCVVGWYISLLPFCATTALAAVKDMCSRDPLIEPGGVAESILPDNGPDLASIALRGLCNRVGMHINPAKTYCPDDKAHLERFFRTLNEQLIHLIQGTTFSSPTERGDYDSKGNATVTLERIRELFKNWVDNVYHRSIHSGTGRAPMLAWRDQQKEMPILSFSKSDMDAIARVAYKRKINNGRVMVENLSFHSNALATLEQRNQRHVTVLLDELNLSHVFVQHESDPKLLIRADAVRASYTNDLTMYEHKEVEKKLKKMTRKDLDELGAHAQEIARWNLWREIHDVPNLMSSKRLKLLTEGVGKKKVAKNKVAAVQSAALSAPFNSDHSIQFQCESDGLSPVEIVEVNVAVDAESIDIPVQEFATFSLPSMKSKK